MASFKASAFPPLPNAPLTCNSYFEFQEEAQCARHALNNCLGGPHFSVAKFEEAVQLILRDSAFAAAAAGIVSVDTREQHSGAGGWYSEEVIAAALRLDTRWGFDQTSLAIVPDGLFELTRDGVMGALVHRGNHWFALKLVDGKIYEFDSLKISHYA